MIENLFQSSTIPVLEKVVQFTQARHGVLAGNIANLDTPGYKTRDLNVVAFREQLHSAVARGGSRRAASPGWVGAVAPLVGPNYQSPGLSRSDRGGEPIDYDQFRDVDESMKSILFHDESDVALEKQITEIAKNQSLHNLAVSLMVSQMKLLSVAISEQVT